ncbi:hypothetical protein HK098_001363 [Nowakowskiella sp. JEL0407]|nr:hypothetical protein HK098_001363 [Nowakowskiella sp. JEL0407]
MQGYTLTKQWESGYRCFNADVYNLNGVVQLCHGTCDIFNVGPFSAWLAEFKQLLDKNPNDVVTLFIENSGTPKLTASTIAGAFTSAGISPATYFLNQDSAATSAEQWPSLSTMISTGKRLVVFTTNTDPVNVPWILDYDGITAETSYTVNSAAGFNCSQFRPKTGTRPLFILNHFMQIDVLGAEIANYAASETTNSESSINNHIAQCNTLGTFFNYLLVDWGNVGSALSVVAKLNGVTSTSTNGNGGPIVSIISDVANKTLFGSSAQSSIRSLSWWSHVPICMSDNHSSRSGSIASGATPAERQARIREQLRGKSVNSSTAKDVSPPSISTSNIRSEGGSGKQHNTVSSPDGISPLPDMSDLNLLKPTIPTIPKITHSNVSDDIRSRSNSVNDASFKQPSSTLEFFTELAKDLDELYVQTATKSPKLDNRSPLESPKVPYHSPLASSHSDSGRDRSYRASLQVQTRTNEIIRESHSPRNGIDRGHSDKSLRLDELSSGSHPHIKKAVRGNRASSIASSQAHAPPRRFEKEFIINEEVIVPEYVFKLQQTIMNDPVISPNPSQFLTSDGYESWLQTKSGERLQETLCSLIHARYIHPNGTIQKMRTRRLSHIDTASEKSGTTGTSSRPEDLPKIFFKVVKARKLILKEGKSRDVYCSIDIGDISVVDSTEKHKRRLKDSFTTETVTVHSRAAKHTRGFPRMDRKNSYVTNSEDEEDYGKEEEDSESVFWNQHLNIPVKGTNDMIVVKVWDRKKDYFLGEVRLLVNEVKEWCEKENDISRWYKLNPRKLPESGGLGINQKRDRYVGGEIYLEAALADEELLTTAKLTSGPSFEHEPEEYIRSLFVNHRVNLRELYKMLLRACLTLDMRTLTSSITENTEELLSLESRTLLTVFGGAPRNVHHDTLPLEGGVNWDVGDAFQVISYVALLFERYQSYQIPTSSLKAAYHTLRDCLKLGSSWLPEVEIPHLLELLGQMHAYYTSQVTNYKDFYPYRPQPSSNYPHNTSTITSPNNHASNIDALKTTLFMLRMINKEPIYRKAHPNTPESFRDELKKMMTEAAVVRFQRFQNLNSPLDESIVSDVVDGFLRLADFCIDDVKLDHEYYEKAFSRELSITQLVGETYLKYFILTLESQNEVFVAEEAVTQCADLIFALYHRVKSLEDSFKSLEIKTEGVDLEAWFVPFVRQWLQHLNDKTIEWVTNALKADNFEFIHTPTQSQQLIAVNPVPDTELLAHSSSVTDLFSVIYQELEFILGLNWHHPMQHASFLQAFARTTFNAIDQFCYTISIGEISDEQAANPAWNRLTSLAKLTQKEEPKDIQNQACVKLCNMEYAIVKLEDLYNHMNVSSVAQSVREYKLSLPQKPVAASQNAGWKSGGHHRDDVVKGAFGIQVAYAEDLKPCNKNGLANPYVVVRVPDGTLVPPQPIAEGSDSRMKDEGPTILAGKECEIMRTRTQYDTVNPQWDEKFQMILPPIQKLEVIVYSRNIISSDQVAGRAEIPLTKGQYALKQLLEDHQTHDVFVELEPQGRVLFRLTLDGEDEDVDFWFRKSRERMWRTRDDFVRGLAAKITPYCREMILKAIRVHEAAPLNQKTILQSVADRIGINPQKKDANADQQPIPLSSFTYSGISIEQPVTAQEADDLLSPLTDYLNKNLGTLCLSLSPAMAQEVIKRIWDEVLGYVEVALAPPLYGLIERDRRFLNSRQVTMVDRMLRILQDFFHADGQGLGLSMEVLNNKRFANICLLLGGYHDPDIKRLMKEYETSLVLSTKTDADKSNPRVEEKSWLLRLLRLRVERQEDLSIEERENYKKWVYFMLDRRRR